MRPMNDREKQEAQERELERLRKENERLRGDKQREGSKDWMRQPGQADGPGRVRRSG